MVGNCSIASSFFWLFRVPHEFLVIVIDRANEKGHFIHVLCTLVVEVREIDHKYSSSMLSASMAAMFRRVSSKAECSEEVHLPVCAAAAGYSIFICLHHLIIICC